MDYLPLDTVFKRRAHNIFRNIITTYAKNKCPKILDVGCGAGVMGRLLGQKSNIFGIELDRDLAKLAEAHCEKVYHLDLEKLRGSDIQEDELDFIIFGDVLEHIKNPKYVIDVLKEKLKPGGYAVFSLPNIAQIQFRIKLLFGNFDYEEVGVLAKSHLRLYTYKSSVELIRSAGLKIIRFYPSGTIVSFLNIFPKLLCSQFIFLCTR